MSSSGKRLRQKIATLWFLWVLVFLVSCIAVAQGQNLSPPPRDEKTLQDKLLARPATELKRQLSPAQVGEVRVIYLLPSDVKQRAKFRRAAADAIQNLQRWYGIQLAGSTFKLHTSVVETFRTSHPAEWYAKNPSGQDRTLWFWNNATTDGFSKTGGAFDDPRFRWVFYIDAEPDADQVVGGANGVALLTRNDVLGILGLQTDPACRWVGGLGHELGHAFGLDHPLDCQTGKVDLSAPQCQSLMFLGYTKYCGTFLTPEHKTDLEQSPFFSPQEVKAGGWKCSN
jgi:hypothetical protein